MSFRNLWSLAVEEQFYLLCPLSAGVRAPERTLTLHEKFPGIYVNADESRSIYVAPAIIRSLISKDKLRDVLVLALGTNGPIERRVLDEIRVLIGPDRQMVVVNVQAPRYWTAGVNTTLSSFALSYRDVELANWHDAIQPSLNLLAGDQIHFGSAGATVFSADDPRRAPAAGRAAPPA